MCCSFANTCASPVQCGHLQFHIQECGHLQFHIQVSKNREIALPRTCPLSIFSQCRPRTKDDAQLYNDRASRTMSVPRETAKQLDFKMKLMGLAVVFMVLNMAASAPAPAPVLPLALPLTIAGPIGSVALAAAVAPKAIAAAPLAPLVGAKAALLALG